MDKAGWKAPIHFTDQTDLVRSEQYNIEKNWAPFLGDGDEVRRCTSRQRTFPLTQRPPAAVVPRLVGAAGDLQIRRQRDIAPTRPIPSDAQLHHRDGRCGHPPSPLPPRHPALAGDHVQARRLHTRRRQHVAVRHHPVRSYPPHRRTMLMIWSLCSLKYHPEPYLFYERRVVTWSAPSRPYPLGARRLTLLCLNRHHLALRVHFGLESVDLRRDQPGRPDLHRLDVVCVPSFSSFVHDGNSYVLQGTTPRRTRGSGSIMGSSANECF